MLVVIIIFMPLLVLNAMYLSYEQCQVSSMEEEGVEKKDMGKTKRWNKYEELKDTAVYWSFTLYRGLGM